MKRITALVACIGLFAVFVLALCAPVFAAQDGTITFTLPTTGGAITGACATATPATCGIRLFRDNTLVGPITPGQAFPALFPNDTATYQLGIETWNVSGVNRVTKTLALTALPLPPGPVQNIQIVVNCTLTTPATCTAVAN